MNKEEKFRKELEKSLTDVVDRMIKNEDARNGRDLPTTILELIDFLTKSIFGESSVVKRNELFVKNCDIIFNQSHRFLSFLDENSNSEI